MATNVMCRVQTEFRVEAPYILHASVLSGSEGCALSPKSPIIFHFDGVPRIIIHHQMGALPSTQIGSAVGDASARCDEVVVAIYLWDSGVKPERKPSVSTVRGWGTCCPP